MAELTQLIFLPNMMLNCVLQSNLTLVLFISFTNKSNWMCKQELARRISLIYTLQRIIIYINNLSIEKVLFCGWSRKHRHPLSSNVDPLSLCLVWTLRGKKSQQQTSTQSITQRRERPAQYFSFGNAFFLLLEVAEEKAIKQFSHIWQN